MGNHKDRTNEDVLNGEELLDHEIPPGVDRRKFLMRSAVIGAGPAGLT